MRVTIVGAGNAGYSHSAMFSERGHEVTLLKTTHLMYDDSFEWLKEHKQISYIKDGLKGKVKLHKATRNIEEAISGAEVIFVLTQSVAHKHLSEMITPYLKEGQALVVSPGYCGSFYFSTKCKGKNILFAEGESLPFDARITGIGIVDICNENVRNPLGFFPSNRTKEGIQKMKEVLPSFTERNNILESAFHNPNLIVHTVGAIMSVGRIEYSKGDFWMYREAFTPTIWRLINKLDQEKCNILGYFNLPRQSFADSFQFRTYEDLEEDSMVAFKHYAMHGSPKGPLDAKTRYITEDVPMGLCFMSSVGKKIGIETPVCNSLIEIASAMHDVDYFKIGRTLKDLGMEKYTQSELLSLLRTGF
jgi:opine dehydrogenase